MPAGHKNTYATIEEIVAGVCLDLLEGNQRELQYSHWAIKYVKKWKMDRAREVKTVRLTMTPWKSIIMPEDCIDWIKLGIQDGNMVKTFVHTKDIATYYDKDGNGQKIYNDDPVDPTSDILNVPVDAGNTWDFMNLTIFGENPGRLFGLQMRDNGLGYFQEIRSEDSCEIQLRTKVSSDTPIYLEYLAEAVSPNKKTLIHPYAVDWITAGIHFERHKHGNKDKGAIQIAREELAFESTLLLDRMWDYNMEEILEWQRYGYKMSPKN